MTKHILITLCFLTLPVVAGAQTSNCGATLTADAQAVTAELQSIANQASQQGFQDAVQQLAADLHEILPSLTPPDRLLVEKFLTDLASATSSSSPGGTSITATERITLTNDIMNIMTSTGMTSSQIQTLFADLQTVMGTLEGISTVQLQAAVQKMITDAQACKR